MAKMKIAAVCCSLDEEFNIARFIEAYLPWVDWILVADGGSADRTKVIAESYPSVSVKDYKPRFWINEALGLWRNPIGGQRNFLIDWATELGADWLVLDDCDSVPNALLRASARQIVEECERDLLFAVRLYLWRDGLHFPNLAKPTGSWAHSIWGWRLSSGLRCVENDLNLQWTNKAVFQQAGSRCNIDPPMCLLHKPWGDEKTLQLKLARYRSLRHPNMKHPLEFGGPLEPLPEWAIEK